MNTKLLMAAAVCGLALSAVSSHAEIIINETFSGLSGTDLTDAATPDGNSWTGASNTEYKADGSIANAATQSAYLGFTFTQGLVYTLQVDINPTGTNPGYWLAAGFSTDAGDGSDAAFQNSANTYAWLLSQNNGGAQSFTGLNASGGLSHTPAGNTFKIVLDTSDSLNYTVEFYDGNVSLRGPVNIGTPAIDTIWISSFANTGSFDNLTLTATPEPGSLSLLGLGGLCLIKRRRRG